MQEEELSFTSGPGLRLSARVFHPTHAGPCPGVVMCHGFGGIKDDNPPPTARLLAAAGYRVLTWDYRGFGESEGSPGRLVPDEQIEDLVTAIEFFSAREDVLPGGVSLWGSSWGGGIAAGALSRGIGVRCAVLIVPAVFAGRDTTSALPPSWGNVVEDARRALVHKARTGEITMIDRGEILRDPITRQRYGDKAHPMALESMMHFQTLTPVDWSPYIRQPVLVVVVRADLQIPLDRVQQFHDRLAGEKKLHIFEHGNHYSVYGELLQETVGVGRAWLDRHALDTSGVPDQ